MIRVSFILLSLCCTAFCAFVAYSSNEAAKDRILQEVAHPTPACCNDLLDNPPKDASQHLLVDFERGKYFASRDWDEDGIWELVCVPFFPDHWERLEYNYPAAIICFRKVPDLDSLKKIIDQGKINVRYCPNRQALDDDIHSRLATKYTSLDFKNSIVLYYGFEDPLPILSSPIFVTSTGLAAISMVIGIWSLFLMLIEKRETVEMAEDQPITNRAGLPEIAPESVESDIKSEEALEVAELARKKLESATFDVFSRHSATNV